MIYHVKVGEQEWTVDLAAGGVVVDGRTLNVDLARTASGPLRSLIVDGVSHRLVAHRTAPERWDIQMRGRQIRADVVDERTRAIREMSGTANGPLGPRPIRAPMPGMVVRVEVKEGDLVRAGQGVVIVEAMKMENELTAETDAVVTRVHVTEGQAVEKDQLLVDVAAPEADA